VNREIQKVPVQIFGELYVIRGNGSQENINKMALEVDQRMKEIAQKFPRLAVHQVATLLALNLTDELRILKEEQNTLMDMLGEKKGD